MSICVHAHPDGGVAQSLHDDPRADPCASINVAAEWRRSWKRMRGNPAATRMAWKRCETLRASIGVPMVEVKTNPHSCQRDPASRRSWSCWTRCWRSAETTTAGIITVRRLRVVFGSTNTNLVPRGAPSGRRSRGRGWRDMRTCKAPVSRSTSCQPKAQCLSLAKAVCQCHGVEPFQAIARHGVQEGPRLVSAERLDLWAADPRRRHEGSRRGAETGSVVSCNAP